MESKKPGPRRVEAWIYAVINPLEEALERETLDGLRRSPTYRWRSESSERLMRLREYLPRSAGLILDDLASCHPLVRDLERSHDEGVRAVVSSAKVLFDALVANGEFRAFAEQHFVGVNEPESVVNDVAEDLVNDDPEFVDPKVGTYREGWNRALDRLKAFRAEANYEPLSAALKDVEGRAERAKDELTRLRARLVEEFDVPPAPVFA